MSDPDIRGVFRRPFTEQVAFFRSKLGNLVPTQRWDDMLREAHDSGFMVAGAMEADLLTDLAAATDKAIAEGTGIEAFRKDFRAIVRRNGWTGWTGEGSVKGEAWRVGVIYRTNMATSYAAGRYAQLVAGKFAYWVYRHGDSRDPRPEHVSWDGLALEPEHEFWATRYPPSDWGCSCYVVGASSEAAVKRLGGDLAKKPPANWKKIDPSTGAPLGVGRGWDYAPGASAAGRIGELIAAIAGKLGGWDAAIAKAFLNSLPVARADALSDAYRALPSTADQVRRYAQRVYDPEPGGVPLRPLPTTRSLGLANSRHRSRVEELIGAPIDGYDFSIDISGAGHVRNHHGPGNERQRDQRAVEPIDFARLPEIIADPDAIELAGESNLQERVIEFRRKLGREVYIARFAIRGSAKRTLALKTFFIKR